MTLVANVSEQVKIMTGNLFDLRNIFLIWQLLPSHFAHMLTSGDV